MLNCFYQKLSTFFHSLKNVTSDFSTNKRGNVAIILAFSVLPIFGTMAFGVDYAGVSRFRMDLQSAADGAAIIAAREAMSMDSFDIDTGPSPPYERSDGGFQPIWRATLFFDGTLRAQGVTQFSRSVVITHKGMTFSSKITYRGTYKSVIPFEFNPFEQMVVEGEATASVDTSLVGYADIHFLLDVSPSMQIGANQSDINWLQKNKGCVFDCHHERPSYIKSRIDILRAAVLNAVGKAEKLNNYAKLPMVRIAARVFNTKSTKIVDLTTNAAHLRSIFNHYLVTTDPNQRTAIWSALDTVKDDIPNSTNGDGLTPETPKRFLILVTDGLEDRADQPSASTPAPWQRPYGYWMGSDVVTGAFDHKRCDAIKNKGVTVAVIYTTFNTSFLNLENDEARAQHARLIIGSGERGGIPNAIVEESKACASPGYYAEASDGTALTAAMNKIFKLALAASIPSIKD